MDNNIIAIAVKFQQHSSAKYWQAHHELDTQYTGLITDIQDLFDKTDKSDVPAFVTSKVVKLFNLTPE